MVLLGSGNFTYEVSGDNWGNLPEGAVYREATSVDVDDNDNVYVFNRGTHPMVVFDSNGDVVSTWGHGVFTNPHAVTVAPDGTIWCVDNGDHTVRQFTSEGKLLKTIGSPGIPAAPMSGKPFSAPTHAAFDTRNGDFYVTDGYSNARVHKYSPMESIYSHGASLEQAKVSSTSSTTLALTRTAGCTSQTARTTAFRYSVPKASSRLSGSTCPAPHVYT